MTLMHADVALGVCLENPKHHPAARVALGGLRPSCMLNPHDCGTPESKPTCFFTTPGMSTLLPTAYVTGRNRRLANLSPSVWRSDFRSEFYLGIAQCAAATWTGDLIRFIQSRQSNGRRSTTTCAEMVERARALQREEERLGVMAVTRPTTCCPGDLTGDDARASPKQLWRAPEGWVRAPDDSLPISSNNGALDQLLGVVQTEDALAD